MQKPALVFVNAPPRAGKDTAVANVLVADGYVKHRFAEPIRRALAGFFNLPRSTIDDIVENHKGKSHPALHYAEVRDLMIGISEGWAKPRMGRRVFGHMMAHDLDQYATLKRSVVVPDAGFDEEVDSVVEAVGHKFHMLLVLLHRGPKEQEKWDSRKRLDPKRWGMNWIEIHNDGPLYNTQRQVTTEVRYWYNQTVEAYADADR